MELKAFQEKNKKKNLFIMGSISFLLLIIFVVVMRTYAIYQEQKEYDVIEGSVPEFMDDFDVKVALTIDGSPATTFPEKNSGKTVDSIVCNKGASATWDYEKWDIVIHNVQETKTKCQVSFVTKYTDSVLNGNDPVLSENLIPVTIENVDGENVVKKASQKDAWYDYTKKQWANAIILVDENETYTAGQVIPEEKIESYFVWIPKFDYQIFNVTDYPGLTSVMDQVKTIQVRFRGESTTDTSSECKSPNKSGDIGTCEVGKWMTHPAFVDGFEGKRGMWVGKFEPSNAFGHTDVMEPEYLQIKPGVFSWKSARIANMFYSSFLYKRELDSHMMKNTEWGAVAYFTQSIYGRCSGSSSCEEIRYNNYSDNQNNSKTGYVGVHEPTIGFTSTSISCTGTPEACNEYGTTSDVTRPWNDASTLGLASTTKNLSGIYDMAGGNWEYVMGVMATKDGQFVSGRDDRYNSNFIGALTYPTTGNDTTKTEWYLRDGGVSFPETKYFDIYQNGENDQMYGRMILGDATGEMGPFGNRSYDNYTRRIHSWNSDEGMFVRLSEPWFLRGHAYHGGIGTGVFAFADNAGQSVFNISFRVVLSF